MRVAAAAVTFLHATILQSPSYHVVASPSSRIGHDSFATTSRVNHALHQPWGIIPYGGETSYTESMNEERKDNNNETNIDERRSSSGGIPESDASPSSCTENAHVQQFTTKTASSKIIDSVSAGGAFPSSSHVESVTPAFVGSSVSKSMASSSSSTTTTTTAATTTTTAATATATTACRSPPYGTTGQQALSSQSQQTTTTALSVATGSSSSNDAATAAAPKIIAIASSTNNKETNKDENNETIDEAKGNNSSKGRKNGPLKILFLSSDTGGGHRASAEALANQFQRHYPGTTYDLMDCWTDIDSCWPYYTIKDTYKSFSATPWKWRTLYHVSNNALYAKFVDYHSYYLCEKKIREKMKEYDADVIVSVHPTMNYVPLFAIRKISEKRGRDIPFFTVVTDFGSGHCTWFNKDVDKMYLASEPIKKIAQKRGGVPDDKIVMTGLPIRYDFASQADAMGDRTTDEGKAYQKQMREQLNLDPNKRMVLVMGGGEGVGSLSDIVNELYAKLRLQGVDATICVVCGRNEQLKNDLETRCWDTVVSQSLNSYESLRSRFFSKLLQHASRSRRIQMALDRAAAKAAKGKDVAETPGKVDVVPLGFVTNMAEYMVAADVLVSKAGPGTIAEAAAVGLPVMVTSHLPGQEAGNVDIVLNGGFGDYCVDPESIALEVACWLQDPQLLDVMSQKAMKVGHPHAAEEIVLDIGEITHQWLERNEVKSNGLSP